MQPPADLAPRLQAVRLDRASIAKIARTEPAERLLAPLDAAGKTAAATSKAAAPTVSAPRRSAPKTSAPKTSAKVHRLPAARAAAKQRVDAEVHEDGGLARVPGIGPGLIWKLGRAGVHSLGDLAAADAAQLRDRFGAPGRLVDFDSWITFARTRDLAGQ